MGNSEVGHLTIGAGRVIYQDVMRISKAIETGAFARNEVLLGAIRRARDSGRTLHLWGLLSDASVHSHINHLFALLELAAGEGLRNIAVHAVLDGRDTPPRSALPFVDALEAKLKALGCGKVATVSGRYFAMDRDKRWERVERAWRAIVLGEGIAESSARAAVEHAYAANQSDEFVEPRVIAGGAPLKDGDQVVCFNFRADRARELTAALALEQFNGFARPRFPRVGYVCMTEYDRSFGLPLAFGPEDVKNALAEVLARAGVHNLRIAETEKYAHVTYFLNGGVEKPFPLEERVLIPSSKVATYDLEPAMQADKIAERAAAEIVGGKFGVDRDELRQPGHGGPHRQTRSDDQGDRDDGRGARQGYRRGRARARRRADNRRSRQRRVHGRPRNRPGPHRAHDLPGAADTVRPVVQGKAARRRHACRCRADVARYAWN